jgi:glycosyltransferase involved in cell wall biosynthesis
MTPLVTCICPTMPSRREWLPKAIACFKAQTYPEKELLILADGFDGITAWAAEIQTPDCRMITISVPPGMSIGAKRNLGAELAKGEFIANLDDDDHSHPHRLADQVSRLQMSGKSVTGYHSIKFHEPSTGRWWQYRGHPLNWAFDASLCYLKSFWQRHPFAPINDGLEASFRSAAIRERQFVTVDGSDQMYATIHPDNTGRRVITPGSPSWEELPFADGGPAPAGMAYLVGE